MTKDLVQYSFSLRYSKENLRCDRIVELTGDATHWSLMHTPVTMKKILKMHRYNIEKQINLTTADTTSKKISSAKSSKMQNKLNCAFEISDGSGVSMPRLHVISPTSDDGHSSIPPSIASDSHHDNDDGQNKHFNFVEATSGLSSHMRDDQDHHKNSSISFDPQNQICLTLPPEQFFADASKMKSHQNLVDCFETVPSYSQSKKEEPDNNYNVTGQTSVDSRSRPFSQFMKEKVQCCNPISHSAPWNSTTDVIPDESSIVDAPSRSNNLCWIDEDNPSKRVCDDTVTRREKKSLKDTCMICQRVTNRKQPDSVPSFFKRSDVQLAFKKKI